MESRVPWFGTPEALRILSAEMKIWNHIGVYPYKRRLL